MSFLNCGTYPIVVYLSEDRDFSLSGEPGEGRITQSAPSPYAGIHGRRAHRRKGEKRLVNNGRRGGIGEDAGDHGLEPGLVDLEGTDDGGAERHLYRDEDAA